MKTSKKGIQDSSPGDLRALLDASSAGGRLWSPDDLQDVFAHQWAAPLAIDLGGMGAGEAKQVETLAASKQLLLKSFGDLLQHERPPLPLLALTKEFAKRCLHGRHSPIPRDVARVFYFASIAAALTRCGTRISSLSDDKIIDGISWALALEWLGPEARDVLASGLKALSGGRGEP